PHLDGRQIEPSINLILNSSLGNFSSCKENLCATGGGIGFKNNSLGHAYGLGYQNRQSTIRIRGVRRYYKQSRELLYSRNINKTGFDKSRQWRTSIRLKFLKTQLGNFIKNNFYTKEERREKNKRIPKAIYELPYSKRKLFIYEYWQSNGCGYIGKAARISSCSKEALIDTAWLARISGLGSSVFKKEVRIENIQNKKGAYNRYNLLPANIFVKFAKKYGGKLNYLLRHALYWRKAKRVEKTIAKKVIELVKNKEDISKLKKLINSDIHVVKIKDIELVDYNDFVYDISVPGSQVFWGGSTPILLHNSDERGIDTIRTRVKDFARTTVLTDIPFKLMILDEADNMTADAQQALRRTMERYSRNTRFILDCNYSSKIIEPIQSRCAIFRFKPIDKLDVFKRLKEIADNEGVKITEDGLEAIFYVSEGDMRKAINTLEAAASLEKEITPDTVYQVTGKVRPEEINNMLTLALKGKFIESREKLRTLLIDHGLSGTDIVKQAFTQILKLPVDEKVKIKLMEALGEVDYRIVEGANDDIQITYFLAYLADLGAKLNI
ncbi:MAG: replication factor C small subunit, partial [Candidatus Odinarchaeia archaeon]